MNWFNKRSGVENEGMGCGWGLVHIIKHHHWPHFLRRLTHHHKSKRILGSRTTATRTTNDAKEEHDKLIVGEVTAESSLPRKNSPIKSRMRSLLAEEMLRIKTTSLSSHQDRSDGLDSERSDPRSPTIDSQGSNKSSKKPKQYLDALGIISANEEFLVKVLQDPGSPLADHFRNQQALSAKRSLSKSETFPLPASHNNPTRFGLGPNYNDPLQQQLEEEEEEKEKEKDHHHDHGVVMKRLKDLKQKIKLAIRDHKKEMPKVVALDAIIHRIPIDKEIDINSRDSPFKPKPRHMRRASSLNDSSDRYSQIYETTLDREPTSHAVARRTRVAPKHLSRIYSLPDMRFCDIGDVDVVGSRKSIEERTVLEDDLESVVEVEEDPLEEYEETEIIEEEEEEEESSNEVKAKDKAEFRYVMDVLESSGLSEQTLMGSSEAKGCLVFDPNCCGNNKSGGKCDHPLLFDLINEVLTEIYANSYTYYPFPLSSLSHTCPMPVGQHVLNHVWGLVSSYLTFVPPQHVDHSLDFVVGSDLAKSGWWMNLQFDCECVGLELEDLIFHHLLDELISDVSHPI